MGIIGKITNRITHGQDLEKAKADYNRSYNDYQELCMQLELEAQRLYELRKESLRNIQQLKSYIDKLQGCPEFLQEGVDHALTYADAIREAWEWESIQSQTAEGAGIFYDVVMGGAAAVGGAVATAGPAAAMAFATTFGTASTGTAISSLGGAAAANAALAWIGGGAAAAGGGGMILGNAILGMLGPIGWGVAGVALAGGSVYKRKKNDDAIKEIEKHSAKIKPHLTKLRMMKKRLKEIIDKTSQINREVTLAPFSSSGMDYQANSFPQRKLFETVGKAKILGKISREAINIS